MKALFAIIMAVLMIPVLTGPVCADVGYPTSEHVKVSLLNQIPDPAKAGEIVELRFTVENEGGDSTEDLTFELVTQYPFVEIPGEEYVKTVNALRPHQEGSEAVTLKYSVRVDKDAVKGTNEIKLRRSKTGSDISVTDSFDVDITGAEYAQIIYVDKSIISPGEETPLNFTITNVGTSPLQNLVFSWSEEDGVILPVYSDDTRYIKYLDVGESIVLDYMVVADINTNPGLYQLDLKLTYEAQNGISSEMNTKAGIFIGGETDFDVTFSESSAGQTSLSVANIGNNPALSVTVRIPNQDSFAVSGSTSSIIGNLDRGDYTIVSFQITQSLQRTSGGTDFRNMRNMSEEDRQRLLEGTNPSGSNDLKVSIEYTDTAGKRHTVEKSVPIQFRSLDSNTTIQTTGFRQRTNTTTVYLPYIAAGVLVVAAVVCYKKREFIRKKIKASKGKKV
ncbi:MAG: COG1361 S-layer family protein [Candidatus Aenigmarchaeota archaeon]|nr:COG1361 S-layer family protein [Candidatus Aenigmarchaeota archaeon]